MGGCCDCCEEPLPSVTFFGLCDAGKTAIIAYLEHHTFRLTHPTLGFDKSTVVYQDKRINVWDVSGRNCEYWNRYYFSSSAFVFVVDGTNLKDEDSFVEYTRSALSNKEVKKAPILIYVNRVWGNPQQEQICQAFASKLELEGKGLKVKIQACDPKAGKGVNEGFDWLMQQVFK